MPAPSAPDYKSLLSRARSKIPEKVLSDNRLQIPPPDVQEEGKATVIANFEAIASLIRRDPHHILRYLTKEFGVPCQLKGSRAVLQRKLGRNALTDKMNVYYKDFLYCHECGKPDTHFEKVERTTVLKCEACGGHRPVKTI
ncbi:MAG: translation initiation factor IF-2 subunit beta [Methanobacteriota archaeon]